MRILVVSGVYRGPPISETTIYAQAGTLRLIGVVASVVLLSSRFDDDLTRPHPTCCLNKGAGRQMSLFRDFQTFGLAKPSLLNRYKYPSKSGLTRIPVSSEL